MRSQADIKADIEHSQLQLAGVKALLHHLDPDNERDRKTAEPLIETIVKHKLRLRDLRRELKRAILASKSSAPIR